MSPSQIGIDKMLNGSVVIIIVWSQEHTLYVQRSELPFGVHSQLHVAIGELLAICCLADAKGVYVTDATDATYAPNTWRKINKFYRRWNI